MIQLAQTVADASEGLFGLGLSTEELLTALGFFAYFVASVVKHLRDGKKVRALVEGLHEARAADPEGAEVVAKAIKNKASNLGVESGVFGLKKTVTKHTTRLDRAKAAEAPKETP